MLGRGHEDGLAGEFFHPVEGMVVAVREKYEIGEFLFPVLELAEQFRDQRPLFFQPAQFIGQRVLFLKNAAQELAEGLGIPGLLHAETVDR